MAATFEQLAKVCNRRLQLGEKWTTIRVGLRRLQNGKSKT
jgi:hypothetical protein